MKELIITCRVKDWLDYRCSHKGASEISLANIMVYEGIFNISWKYPSNVNNLVDFFCTKDSIITYVYEENNYERVLKGDTTELFKYSPIYVDSKIKYPIKEIG